LKTTYYIEPTRMCKTDTNNRENTSAAVGAAAKETHTAAYRFEKIRELQQAGTKGDVRARSTQRSTFPQKASATPS